MKKRWIIFWVSMGSAFVVLTSSAIAIQSVLSIRDESLHCGKEPNLNFYEGLVAALAKSESSSSEIRFRQERPELRLELVMHYSENQVDVPPSCKEKLLNLSQLVKTKAIGDLVIRSSTRSEGSKEIDLAFASSRLEHIKTLLREDRLAIKAFVLELHPLPSSVLLEKSISNPRIVEVYSNPVN